jgi:hypothetical protein
MTWEHISSPMARILARAATRRSLRPPAECLRLYDETKDLKWLAAYEQAAEAEQVMARYRKDKQHGR